MYWIVKHFSRPSMWQWQPSSSWKGLTVAVWTVQQQSSPSKKSTIQNWGNFHVSSALFPSMICQFVLMEFSFTLIPPFNLFNVRRKYLAQNMSMIDFCLCYITCGAWFCEKCQSIETKSRCKEPLTIRLWKNAESFLQVSLHIFKMDR